MFHDWRYLDLEEKEPDPAFALGKPEHKGASLLLLAKTLVVDQAENTPWALADFGFKTVIATSFADIFYGNCINNQLVPVALSSEQMDALLLQ